MRVLILGGTAEARALAAALVERDVYVVSSLAGRVSQPRLPVGEVRIGGFGGVAGLCSFLRDERITHLIDATHPFAIAMTEHGAAAARITDIPLIRLARPGWGAHSDAAHWHWANSYDDARRRADELGERPFLTTGRQTLAHFTGPWRERDVLVRVVEPPAAALPRRWSVVLDRGPYQIAGERALMREHQVDVLLTKDSGGNYTAAKLAAAAELKIPVVVIARPQRSAAVVEYADTEAALMALLG